jgi:phenylacetate-coenzyme A ligase PaaK-like adenylate-forming protein
MAGLQRDRLTELVAYARQRSPFLAELYRDESIAKLPVTNKKLLMENFDRWVTDPEVTLEKVRAFVADPALAGTPFLGTYTVATTSGTTGNPGVFVKDPHDVAVNKALSSAMMTGWLSPAEVAAVVAHGGKLAVVAATGGHFMVSAGIGSMRSNWLARRVIRLFSVHDPLPDLVAALNSFQPTILMGYGSVLSLLAAEQRAGRLHIRPVLVEPAGEAVDRELLSSGFQAKVRDTYGCTECPFLTDGCAHGWYHVNTDWAVVEPVDADYRPVPAGELSHTVLISNLANRVQPILRYDLGDSVLMRPDPCECGDSRPALQVQGRVSNMVTFTAASGEQVTLPPLALATLVDRTPGVQLFQLVQTAPDVVKVRLRPTPAADPDQVWLTVQHELTDFLAQRDLAHVKVVAAQEPPQQAAGGKFRTVVPFGGSNA